MDNNMVADVTQQKCSNNKYYALVFRYLYIYIYIYIYIQAIATQIFIRNS